MPIPRPKDQCYLYTLNPAPIHTQSSKINHFLAIADFYIELGKPSIYEVEPQVDAHYTPDAYTRLNVPAVVEVQRSRISNKKMQKKVDEFIRTHNEKKHDAKTLLIVTNYEYKVTFPSSFTVSQIPLKEGVA